MEETLKTAHLNICIRCLGRCFAFRGHGLSNEDRGRVFLSEVSDLLQQSHIAISKPDQCNICKGIFTKIDDFVSLATNEVECYEYSTFLVGCSFPAEILNLESRLQNLVGGKAESIKKEFNREVGKAIWTSTGKNVSLDDPDIIFHYDLEFFQVSIQVKGVFIYGKYRKYRRGVPQTRWIHENGNGVSVEQIIGDELKSLTKCHNYFLHGAGREDVDVRMLGNGREFIIEAQMPQVRNFSLEDLALAINKSQDIEVFDLSFVNKSMISAIKASDHDKTYRVTISAEAEIDKTRLQESALALTGKDIYQRTPLRVSTRRSDLIRKKSVREVKVEEVSGTEAILVITAQAGTYIKELIHGDQGRTDPNLSKTYGAPLTVKSLDVIWIHR